MRCCFQVTKWDNISVSIRTLLHEAFTAIHPKFAPLAEQRLVDQKLVIVSHRRLAVEQVDELKVQAMGQKQSVLIQYNRVQAYSNDLTL